MKAIFATTQDYLLGLRGTMPWALTDEYKEIGKLDMDYFKEITRDAKVVMGYNTWKSLGETPLKGRKEHFIITTKKDLTHDDERVKFLDLKTFLKKYSKEDIICIGGGQIYKELLPYYTEIYWNELVLDDTYKKMLNANKDTRVYLNRKIVHLLKNPKEYGFREPTQVFMLDSKGNSITYNRFVKNKPLSN